MNRKWAHGRFVAPLKNSSSNNSQDSAPNMADEQSFVIEMILFFKRCAVPIVLVVIFLLLPCPEKRRDERRNSKDSAAAPDSACSKPQLSKKCIFRILIILTWVLNMHQERNIIDGKLVDFRAQKYKYGLRNHFWPLESGFLMRRALTQNPLKCGFWSLGIQFYIYNM